MGEWRNIVAIDTETTGLTADDRLVTFGGILVRMPVGGDEQDLSVQVLHIVCDPGRKSHSRAEAVHGWSDWDLRHQDRFLEHAESVRHMIEESDLVIAHNLAFDRGFVSREFDRCGLPLRWPEGECTMLQARARGWPGSLAGAARVVGMERHGDCHGALEDAWMALNLWLALHASPLRLPWEPFAGGPTNQRPSPPKPSRAPNREKYEARAELWRVAGPMLSLLVPLAAADGAVTPAELKALHQIAEHEVSACGLTASPSDIVAIVDMAVAAPIDRDDAKHAARWCADPEARGRLATAAQSLIRADGVVARGEIEELQLLSAIIAEAMAD